MRSSICIAAERFPYSIPAWQETGVEQRIEELEVIGIVDCHNSTQKQQEDDARHRDEWALYLHLPSSFLSKQASHFVHPFPSKMIRTIKSHAFSTPIHSNSSNSFLSPHEINPKRRVICPHAIKRWRPALLCRHAYLERRCPLCENRPPAFHPS